MKFLIALACLLAVAFAENAEVLRSDSEVNIDSFKNTLQLSNGVNFDQSGQLNGDAWNVKTDSSYTSPEGVQVSIKYTADENGVQVLEANPPLPTSPPVPEAILRALQYLTAHAKPEYQN